MARLHTSFVLGYHGCEERVASKVLKGKTELQQSEKDYDWLGPGVYFWEADPVRAWEWAVEKVQRDGCGKPAVVGAVLDLGNCLDLLSRESLSALSTAYRSWDALLKAAELEVEEGTDQVQGVVGAKRPRNGGKDANGDLMLRNLDCQIIRHLHELTEDEPFDSVRGLFTEGAAVFPGSSFKEKTHVQIAVRTMTCIKGTFRVPKPAIAR